MPLEQWFMRPDRNPALEPEPRILDPKDLIIWVEPSRHARAIDIIRRVRKRLVNQRHALSLLNRAYLFELDNAIRREETIADLRNRVSELERALAAKRARSLGNFFQRWFGS